MSLQDTINNDIKSAMLAKEKEKLEALRAVKAALLLAATEKGGSADMSADTEIKLLQRLVKQRREAAEVYTAQNRMDLADPENFQADIIQQYLPKQMSEAEISVILQQIIAETGANSGKDMGKVMGLASKQLAGKADNKMISALIKQMLGA